MRNDFAIFILSHERADNVKTLKTIVNSCNYTGKYYIIIDNEDKEQNRYFELYDKDHVIMFDKLEVSKTTDTCDSRTRERNVVVYARNVCFDIAKQLELEYFLVLDDDYIEFRQRFEDEEGKLSSYFVKDFDAICNEYIDFLETSGALSIAFSQMGDFIGGKTSILFQRRLTRKCMNAFFCKTNRKFDFIDRLNEDTTTYVWRASRGELMFTTADISLNQIDTQQNKGGLTTAYLEDGTYIKSFYSVIVNPSSVKVGEVGVGHKRLHHNVNWNNCAPKILNQKFKKQ